jgi:hypothetical protein
MLSTFLSQVDEPAMLTVVGAMTGITTVTRQTVAAIFAEMLSARGFGPVFQHVSGPIHVSTKMSRAAH